MSKTGPQPHRAQSSVGQLFTSISITNSQVPAHESITRHRSDSWKGRMTFTILAPGPKFERLLQ